MQQKKLSYKTLKRNGYQGYILETGPEKVMQFGEGNFLRGFADYFLDCANEKTGWNGKVLAVSPRGNEISDIINGQDGLYTLYLKGKEHGRSVEYKRIISVISRCVNPKTSFDLVLKAACSKDLELIISNTTEAGIFYDEMASFDDNPPESFPAKLTRVLYSRFCAGLKGLLILTCELIDDSGSELKRCIIAHSRAWNLEPEFINWISDENVFCSTLVDRIVPGKIRDVKEAEKYCAENGYDDELMVVGESYASWLIEGNKDVEKRLSFLKCGLPVKVVSDIRPYRQRKVRILNGGHTGMALGAFLAGKDIVRDCMRDHGIKTFLHKMITCEIIPTIPLESEELHTFAHEVEERFENPYIDHELLSVSLNSTAKWKARNLPSLLEYCEKYGKIPACLTMSLAAYIAFYTNDVQSSDMRGLVCRRNRGDTYPVRDEQWILHFYEENCHDEPGELVRKVLSNRNMWGQDLTKIKGLCETAEKYLHWIRELGAEKAFEKCVQSEEHI